VGTLQRHRDVIEEMMIGRRFMTAVRALSAVNPLMPVLRVQHRFLLFRWREMPGGCFLMVYPNDGVVV
jgi:hypothetical protein